MDNENDNTQDTPKPKGGSSFSKNIVIEYAGGGEIHLNRPTVQQLNAFNKDSRPKGRKLNMENADIEGARVKLFDKLFIKIVNFIDDAGNRIPEDKLEHIPDDEKTHIITQAVQVKEIDIKN